MMHSAPLAPGSRPGAFFGGARSLHIAAGSGQEEARFRPCHGREDAPAAFLGLGNPFAHSCQPAGWRFPIGRCPVPAAAKTPMGSAAALLQQRRFFFLKSILNMHFLQSGGAPHLAGANNSVHPRPPRAGGGPKEKRCRVSL